MTSTTSPTNTATCALTNSTRHWPGKWWVLAARQLVFNLFNQGNPLITNWSGLGVYRIEFEDNFGVSIYACSM